MKVLNPLRELTLLGLSRKPLESVQLPAPLQAGIDQLGTIAAEEKLLCVLGLQYYYMQAGMEPPTYKGSWNTSPIKEEKNFAPQEVVPIFHALQPLEKKAQEAMLRLWLEALIANDWIVPPSLMKALLQETKTFSKGIQEKIAEVIGNRGRWVMEQLPQFRLRAPMQPNDSPSAWVEGKLSERKVFLQHLLEKDRSKALSLLASDWSELSIREKRSHLESIVEHVVPEDHDFLEHLHRTEFTYNQKEKKLQKACRRLISQGLLEIPHSDLYKKTLERLSDYLEIHSRSGLVGKIRGRKKTEFILPTQFDNFWNPEVMDQQYGFEASKPSDQPHPTDIVYWFDAMLPAIPFSTWSQLMNRELAEIMQFFVTHSQFQYILEDRKGSCVVPALVRRAQKEQNEAVAKHLLPYTILNDLTFYHSLLKLLPLPEWESEVIRPSNRFHLFPARLSTCTLTAGAEWTQKASKIFLDEFVKFHIQDQRSIHLESLESAAQFLHTDSLSYLEKVEQKLIKDLPETAVFPEPSLALVRDSLRIRRRLAPYFKTHTRAKE